MSFGPAGRLGMTAVWLFVLGWFLQASPLSAVMWLVLSPFLLKAIWKRTRID